MAGLSLSRLLASSEFGNIDFKWGYVQLREVIGSSVPVVAREDNMTCGGCQAGARQFIP